MRSSSLPPRRGIDARLLFLTASVAWSWPSQGHAAPALGEPWPQLVGGGLLVGLAAGLVGGGFLLLWRRYRRAAVGPGQDLAAPLGGEPDGVADEERLPPRAADLLRRHLGNTPLAVIELDYGRGHPGRISTWSGQAQRIFGWSEQEVLGRSLDDIALVDEADQERRLAAYQRLREDAVNSTEVTVRTRTRDRRLLHCTAHISVARRPDGALDTVLMLVEDITGRVAAQAEMVHLAHHDILTGLANRALFHDRLRQALGRAKRDGGKIALMMIDLDRFKQVNDTHGHGCGDALLRHVGSRLAGAVRETDSPARLGGDEFALIQVGIADETAAELLAERIRGALAQPFEWQGRPLDTSCSIGIALFPDHSGCDEGLLRAADLALYRAKGTGRNRYVFYRKEMDEELVRGRSLQRALAQALEENQLSLVYQPILSLPGRQMVEVEALCRWRGPTGWIPPSTFLPLAQSCGLIHPLGDWVLESACAQGAAWARAGRPVRVAVNLSLAELRREDIAGSIRTALSRSGLPPALLQLELAEAAVVDPARAGFIDGLREVASMGVGISLDDFGSGRCQMAQLSGFPFEAVKLDGALVRDIAKDDTLLAVARGFVQLAHGLGKRVVAEKIEGADQLARLTEIGCDAVQGYFIAPPVPAEQLGRPPATA